jgi:hypothetical protein
MADTSSAVARSGKTNEIGHYVFGGYTTTTGAHHAHPNAAKGHLQRENGKKFAHAAMVTAVRARYGPLPFRPLQLKSRDNIFT